jgi:hypothetical protein
MAPKKEKKQKLTPEEVHRLMDEYQIVFEGPLIPSQWPAAYRDTFEKISQIKSVKYDRYGEDGRLNDRTTVLANVSEMKWRAWNLRNEAHQCRHHRENEETWRMRLEHLIAPRFTEEVIW